MRRLAAFFQVVILGAGAVASLFAAPNRVQEFELLGDGAARSVSIALAAPARIREVRSGDPSLFVLDIPGATFLETRQRLPLPQALGQYAVLSQYDKRSVRLVVRHDPAIRIASRIEGTKVLVELAPPGTGFRPKDPVVAAAGPAVPAVGDGRPAGIAPGPGSGASSGPGIYAGPLAFLSRAPNPKPRIVIDPGHGGRDPGALGKKSTDKQIALAVGLELEKVITKDPRLEVYLTRSEDRFVRLEDRAALARKVGADLFVSLHANSSVPKARGYEVWYLSRHGSKNEASRVLADRENASHGPGGGRTSRSPDPVASLVEKVILDKKREECLNHSSLLAGYLNRSLAQTGQPSRGVNDADFLVLRSVEVPSVLLELGFLSHPAEEALLLTPEFQQKQAKAIYQGICAYLESQGRLGTGAPTKTWYAVRPKDTLSGIASRYGVDVVDLADANGIQTRSTLVVGQVLVIPKDPLGSLGAKHVE